MNKKLQEERQHGRSNSHHIREKAGLVRRQRQQISEFGLAQSGKKVVAIDTDLGLRNLDVVMGLENRIVYNLVDVIEGLAVLNRC